MKSKKAAGGFEAIHDIPESLVIYKRVLELARLRELGEGSSIIEVGGGTGKVGEIIHELYPEKHFQYANLDSNKAALLQGKGNKIMGSRERLPIKENSVDAVLYLFPANPIVDQKKHPSAATAERFLLPLAEAFRVLKQGGRVVVMGQATKIEATRAAREIGQNMHNLGLGSQIRSEVMELPREVRRFIHQLSPSAASTHLHVSVLEKKKRPWITEKQHEEFIHTAKKIAWREIEKARKK